MSGTSADAAAERTTRETVRLAAAGRAEATRAHPNLLVVERENDMTNDRI